MREDYPTRNNIGEVILGYALHGLHMSNRKLYKSPKINGRPKFTLNFIDKLFGYNPTNIKIMWWIKALLHAHPHGCNFLSIDIEEEMVQMGQWDFEIPNDEYLYPWMDKEILGTTYIFVDEYRMDNAYKDVGLSFDG